MKMKVDVMKRRKYRNILRRIIFSIGLSWVMTGCIYDSVTTDEPASSPVVYLSITRAQAAGTETFNEDATEYEDRVHDLAMLVFDSSTGAKVCEYYDENIPFAEKGKTFTVKLTPGQRDFYFVANMPMSALSGIADKTAMDSYIAAMNNMDAALYQHATETKGFPMSRIYTNQTISIGGTELFPLPFKPDGEDRVRLIRVVAKLEVQISDADFNNDITKITLKNAFSQFHLNHSNTTPFNPTYAADQFRNHSSTGTYLFYMPEALMSNPAWSTDGHRPINYFVIETSYGLTYEVPIITYATPLNEDYMTFATGNSTTTPGPNYNIYRNHHYLYIIKSPLVIYYTVTPWQTVNFQTYLGYGYNVQVDEAGVVSVYNTVAACDPHTVVLSTLGSFKFSDNSTLKTFNSLTAAASAQYQLDPIPGTGAGQYLKVSYNGTQVRIFSK